MEFVSDHEEVSAFLDEAGIEQIEQGEERFGLEMVQGDRIVHLHLGDTTDVPPREGANVVPMERDGLPEAVEQILHKLHLNEVVLMPACKWRNVFDAVAFSLAENEAWQEIDAAATVELNTRDLLLCGPGDYHTMIELIRALLSDAESPDQGMMILSTASPVLIEILPSAGAIRVSVGNEALADEVMESV